MEKKTHDRILVELSDIWIMEGRNDLFEDCLDEICHEYDFYDGKINVKDLTLVWLQKTLFKANPLSSLDVIKMAKYYGETE